MTKHVSGHISAYMAFQKLSFGDPNRNDETYLLGHVSSLHLSGHVSGHISAYMAFQKLSFGDSESQRRDLSFGARSGPPSVRTRFGPYLGLYGVSEALVRRFRIVPA